jgi:hypothetical protein
MRESRGLMLTKTRVDFVSGRVMNIKRNSPQGHQGHEGQERGHLDPEMKGIEDDGGVPRRGRRIRKTLYTSQAAPETLLLGQIEASFQALSR